MRHSRHLFVLPALSIFLTSLGAAGEEPQSGRLSVGWASRNITPSKPVALCGQYDTRISGEVHDPLLVTALALETRNDKGVLDQAVLVSCDLVVVRRSVQEKVRGHLAEKVPDLDPRKIILCATHTHTAPALTDAAEEGQDPYDFIVMWAYRVPETGAMRPYRYVEFLVEQVVQAIGEAWKGRKPSGVSWALSHAVIGHNRRIVRSDGSAQMYGNTTDPAFRFIEGSSDHSLDLLFFWDGEGKLGGMAISVPCPAQELESGSFLSADYWHEVRALLRERHHPELHVLGFCAASGDQSPHLLLDKSAREANLRRRRIPYTQEIARRIARAIDDILDLARADIRRELPLLHRVEDVPLPVREVTRERFEQARKEFEERSDKIAELSGREYIRWRVSRALMARYEHQKTDPFYRAELHILRLGDIAIATNPFELYVDYGMQIEGRSPAEQTFVVQLAADSPAYLPTERAVRGGGYSTRIEDGIVGPEGGQVLVEQTVRLLKELWK